MSRAETRPMLSILPLQKKCQTMDLISQYGDEERNETTSGNVSTGFRSHSIDAAPEVEPLVTEERRKCQSIVGNRTRNRSYVTYNAPAKQIFAPILGPPNPIDRGGMSSIERNTWTGRAEDAHLSSFAFDSQYHAFDTTGRANDPGMKTSEVVLKTEAGNSLSGVASSRDGDGWASRKKPRKERDFLNTEVTPASFRLVSRQPWADKEPNRLHGIEAENLLQETEEHKVASIVPKGTAAIGEEQSTFHGDVEVDYQGRSWIDISAPEVREAPVSFGPRRQIHTWTGHTKGVNAIRFFPNSGHLLLSAGLDGKIKIWSTSGTRRCMRTYHGHTKGVRGTAFSCDGQQFVSFAYDKAIKCWDTETGKVVCRLGDGQTMAYCASLHPDPSQKETLLVGMQNKKIVQYDLRTSDVVQEYDYHLGPVNSVTFVDDNRRFISTSDDKTIRVWEFGIPIQVKYIADPTMHAIYTASLSHSGKWWIGQSADNQVVTYSGDDRTKPIRKKTFQGHTSAGYACEVGFSPDDRHVISGDGDGRLFVWDWKSTKVVRSLKAHDGVCIGVAWHPMDTSIVATCGWDGAIKLWD